MARDVEQEVRRPGIGRQRPSDCAWVDEVIGILAKGYLITGFHSDLVVSKLEDPKSMRIAKGADVRPRWIDGQCPEAKLPEFVAIEPDQLAPRLGMESAVNRNEMLVDAQLQRQTGKKLDSVGAELSARPGHRPGSAMAEPVRRDVT